MTTFADIKTVLKTVRGRYEARIAKAIVDNNDLEPTVDSNGRLHAPCDNYFWINEQIYMGGNYLPEDEEYFGRGETIKIKIATKILDQMNSVIHGSLGKSWNQNGVEMAYFYGSVTKAEKTALLKILPEGGKRVVLADENTTTKTWKFSSGKIYRNAVLRLGKFYEMDVLDYFCSQAAPGVEFDWVKNKKGEYKMVSDFDGKMVCYKYFDSAIYA